MFTIFNLINKNKLIKEFQDEIDRNERYKNHYKGTKDGAMYLGRELALEEVIDRVKKGKEVNCEHTTYMINWKVDLVEELLRNVFTRLKEASEISDVEVLSTVKSLLKQYLCNDGIILK